LLATVLVIGSTHLSAASFRMPGRSWESVINAINVRRSASFAPHGGGGARPPDV